MKLKKIIFYICVILSIFLIYKFTFKDEINYVVLGDSIAEGRNPYGEIGYGYGNYIADYLQSHNKLRNYIDEYAKSEYKIQNIVDDINLNRTVKHNGSYINIKRTLRESDLVTLSIGINDFMSSINLNDIKDGFKNMALLKEEIDVIVKDFDELLLLIKKYAKGDIIVIGYYNPFPYLEDYKEDIDELVNYANTKYKSICEKNKVEFVDIFETFENRTDYLPNPFNIHPNIYGYQAIFDRIKPLL